MDELEITKDLIRVLAFYGILKDWDMYEYCCGSVKNRGIMHGMKYLKKNIIK